MHAVVVVYSLRKMGDCQKTLSGVAFMTTTHKTKYSITIQDDIYDIQIYIVSQNKDD